MNTPAPSDESTAPPATPRPQRPTPAFMLRHPAHLIALGFGSGLSPFAPGTVGTLWGWVAYMALLHGRAPQEIGLVIAVSTLLGWWVCTATADRLRLLDPSEIVWDEVVAFWLVLWLVMPTGFWGQLVAFALFRFFDAVKPGPVGWADRRFHGFGWRGGLGIMLDDLVAAACTLLVIALWRAWV